jgi:hypothetical protein
MKRAGLVRVELKVRRRDAALLRRIARSLADPDEGEDLRRILKTHASKRVGLKALLAMAPLEGVDLERPRDLGRKVEL